MSASDPYSRREHKEGLPRVGVNYFKHPAYSGWLWKCGGRRKSWKRRFFILEKSVLFYYKTPGSEAPIGVINLTDFNEIHVVLDDSEHQFLFELIPHIENARVFQLNAASASDREEWLKVMKVRLGGEQLVNRGNGVAPQEEEKKHTEEISSESEGEWW